MKAFQRTFPGLSVLFLAISFIFISNDILCEEVLSKPKLGIVLPLSGRASSAGEAVRNGANMANQDLGNYFDIVFEDNLLEGYLTLSALRKLIDHDKVDALIVYASGPSNIAAPVAEASSTPMIGMSLDLNVSKNRNWVMIHWASAQNVVDSLFEELKARSISRIGVVTTQSHGILDIEDYFLKMAPSREVEVIYNQQFLPTETDFRTPITVLKAKKPDAVFINLYYGQAGLFAGKASSFGLRTQFFSHFIFDDDSEIKAASGALDGAFFANTSFGDGSFERDYLERFGKRPVIGGIGAYDVVSLFASAVQKSDGSKPSVMKELHSFKNFTGKIGTYSALPDNSYNVPTSVRTISNGKVTNGDN